MKKRLENLNLFQRLLLYFALVMILPLIIVASIIYMQSSNLLEKQTEDYLGQVVTNVNFQTDRFVKNYELVTLPIVSNPNVKHFLDLEENNVFVEEHIRYQYYENIWTMMDNIVIQKPEINRMYILGDNKRQIWLRDKGGSFSEDKYNNLKKITPESGKIIIHPSDQYGRITLTIARKIRGMKSFSPNGILGIEINASELGELWKEANLGNEGFFMIADSNGKVIYHPDTKFIGKTLNQVGKEELSKHKQGTFFDQWNNKSTFFHFLTSEYTGWKLIAAVPKTQLFAPISGVRLTAVISAVMVIFIAFVLSVNSIRQVVKPIQLLERTMKTVEQGEWKKVPDLPRNDEISSLLRSYNRMVDRLSTLVDQVFIAELNNQQVKIELQERELEKQKVEIQALQSQINPHFLYNTLETMNGYGIINGIEEISKMAEALAGMFRYSVRNLELVTLADEIEHVKGYLVIHELRIKKPINLILDIDPSLYNTPMVKLSLQPLVENAIQHGFRKAVNEIIITIRTKIIGSCLHVCVIDNGRGIQDDRLNELREFIKADRKNKPELRSDLGIGVTNVNRRIQLLFGNQYGLDLSSRVNEGTTVSIILPYQNAQRDTNQPA
ncbi:two-component system sensor histidine kinase YesM [Bacillus niacini]|uniref:histidine kinase n=1 Tax=Neobacillus niacini TaxID=86668 RepID=A0A852TIE7_9BACI|nr:sensor histidine kinase [Neobacillus niacini]NYE07961.1 two-component system sensor histidine kinase YesM [Neobacillus niacini]